MFPSCLGKIYHPIRKEKVPARPCSATSSGLSIPNLYLLGGPSSIGHKPIFNCLTLESGSTKVEGAVSSREVILAVASWPIRGMQRSLVSALTAILIWDPNECRVIAWGSNEARDDQMRHLMITLNVKMNSSSSSENAIIITFTIKVCM